VRCLKICLERVVFQPAIYTADDSNIIFLAGCQLFKVNSGDSSPICRDFRKLVPHWCVQGFTSFQNRINRRVILVSNVVTQITSQGLYGAMPVTHVGEPILGLLRASKIPVFPSRLLQRFKIVQCTTWPQSEDFASSRSCLVPRAAFVGPNWKICFSLETWRKITQI
jgi:hypothetical protein